MVWSQSVIKALLRGWESLVKPTCQCHKCSKTINNIYLTVYRSTINAIKFTIIYILLWFLLNSMYVAIHHHSMVHWYFSTAQIKTRCAFSGTFCLQRNKTSDPISNREGDPRSLPQPVQARRCKSRIPANPEMVRDTGLELVRERPDDGLSPNHPQVLETPESLSDSLYDSLSSCGSQG